MFILDLCIPQFNRSWFKPEEASGLRQRIRELLLEEFESARLDHAISKADAPEGYDSIKDGGLEADDSSKMVVEVGDAAKSIKGISVAESDEASAEFGDIGKTNECIKVLASGEASMEYGYKKGTVKTDSSSSKAEKEGKSIVLASPERLKGTEEVMGSMPIPDVVSDSGVKRSEGDEEVTGSMPVPDTVCEITGTKVWITRVYRRPITLPLDNWCRSSGVSSGNARRAFIEHFSRK